MHKATNKKQSMNESLLGKLKRKNPPNWGLLASAAMGVSGFVAARAALAANIHGFGFEAPHARILALASAGRCAFCLLLPGKKNKFRELYVVRCGLHYWAYTRAMSTVPEPQL
jgi:hypothetical protein